ncbi:MAG: hypothetical protein AAFV69_09730, partial [Pseudomonadota bacterium]
RLVAGPDHSIVLPASAILGAGLVLIAEWQTDYDEERPQTSLGGLTPNEFATRSSMDQNPDSLRL